MLTLFARSALALVSVLALALPAAATHNGEQPPAGCRYIRGMATPEDHDDDVYVCRQDVWMHKANTRLGNLAGQGQDTVPSWNTTKPTATLQDGGAAYATVRLPEIFLPYDRTFRPTFEGTFTGTLDNLAATIYLKSPIYEALSIAWPMFVRLTVDGEILYENTAVGAEVDVPMTAEGNLRKIRFVFNNLYAAMENVGLDLSAEKQHSLEISIIQTYWGDGHTVLFYDAAEAASGLIFNLAPGSTQNGYTKIDTAPPAE